MNTTRTAPEGLQGFIAETLEQMRDKAAQCVADDLQAFLAKHAESPSADLEEALAGAPEWFRFALPYATLPDSSVCWGAAKALLALRTAQLMAADQTPEGLTSVFLANEAGLDLFEMASIPWATMPQQPTQEAR